MQNDTIKNHQYLNKLKHRNSVHRHANFPFNDKPPQKVRQFTHYVYRGERFPKQPPPPVSVMPFQLGNTPRNADIFGHEVFNTLQHARLPVDGEIVDVHNELQAIHRTVPLHHRHQRIIDHYQ